MLIPKKQLKPLNLNTTTSVNDSDKFVLTNSSDVSLNITALNLKTYMGGNYLPLSGGSMYTNAYIKSNNATAGINNIAWGNGNTANHSNYSVALGGQGNSANGNASFTGGGIYNNAIRSQSAVIGGYFNNANNNISVVLGGIYNNTNGDGSAILGGQYNNTYGPASTILGGQQNKTYNYYSVILGGSSNQVDGNNSVIIGGNNNTLTTYNSVILGGNFITGTQPNTVYVPQLIINTLGTGTSIKNLGLDINGNVVEAQQSTTNIEIPKLEIKIKSDTPYPTENYGTDNNYELYYKKDSSIENYMFHDKLLVKWDISNEEFLNLNPEIWLFRYTKKRHKNLDGNVINNNSWKHPVHLDGSKYENSAFYSGLNKQTNNTILLRNTEFDITDRGEYQEITINPNDWFTGKDGIRYDVSTPYEEIEDSTYKITGSSGPNRRHFVSFKLAIVVDSDQFNGSTINPLKKKIYGPMSDEFNIFMPQTNNAFYYNNIAYFIYNNKTFKRKFAKSLIIPEPYIPVFNFNTNGEGSFMTFTDDTILDITIDWGDGNIETFDDTYNNTQIYHNYISSGNYNIKITNNNTDINSKLSLELNNNHIINVNNIDKLAHLYSLDLSENDLTEFNVTLPETLEILHLSNNNLTEFNTTLATNLKRLYLYENDLTEFNVTLPETLEILHLSNNNLTEFNTTLPETLEKLYLGNNNLTEFNVTLPQTITELDLSSNLFTQQSIEDLLLLLDNSTFNPGYKILRIESQSSNFNLSAQSQIYVTSLVNKGWDISYYF